MLFYCPLPPPDIPMVQIRARALVYLCAIKINQKDVTPFRYQDVARVKINMQDAAADHFCDHAIYAMERFQGFLSAAGGQRSKADGPFNFTGYQPGSAKENTPVGPGDGFGNTDIDGSKVAEDFEFFLSA